MALLWINKIDGVDTNSADDVNSIAAAVIDNETAISDLSSTKADKSDTYTKEDVDDMLVEKANVTDVYTKGEVDSALGTKVDVGDISLALETKADVGNVYTKAQVDAELESKQDLLTFDTTPTANSNNPVTSKGIKQALDNKATKSTTLAGYGITNAYTKTSMDTKLANKQDKLTFDDVPTADSDNIVNSGVVQTALDELKLLSVPHKKVSDYPVTLKDHLLNEKLISCRIYGAEGGVGDLVTSGEHAGKYKITVEARGLNLFDISRMPNTNEITVEDDKIILTGYSCNTGTIQPNNFLKITGLKPLDKCVYAADISEGTNSQEAAPAGQIRFTGKSGYSSVMINRNNLSGYTIPQTFSNEHNNTMTIYGYSNRQTTILSNFIIKRAEYKDYPYEPYREPSTVTTYLDAPLGVGEYVDIEDLDIVNSAVNDIRVLTENQPSSIEVEYFQDVNKVVSNLQSSIISLGGNV